LQCNKKKASLGFKRGARDCEAASLVNLSSTHLRLLHSPSLTVGAGISGDMWVSESGSFFFLLLPRDEIMCCVDVEHEGMPGLVTMGRRSRNRLLRVAIKSPASPQIHKEALCCTSPSKQGCKFFPENHIVSAVRAQPPQLPYRFRQLKGRSAATIGA
jgi:hypothetical protein